MIKEQKLRNRNFLQLKGFLNTPPLWTDASEFGFQQYEIREIDLQEPLPSLTVPERLVLGKRIEQFFQYYTRHFSNESLLAANQQIIAEKKTLGELDFLLANPSGSVSHVELMYKFYVYDPAFKNEKERWIGPNRRDSLVKKLNRLRNHQFPLLFHKETRSLLDQLKIDPATVQQKVCFKAHLFVPHNFLNKKLPLINNECIAGFWIKKNSFTEPEFGKELFFSPKKQDWPVDPRHGNTWFTFSEIKEQLDRLLRKEQSPLVWMKTGKNEYSRFFIVWW